MNSEKAPVDSLPASTDTDMKLPPLSSAAAAELREMLHGKPDRIELPGNAHYPQETLIMGNIPESVVYVGGDSLTSVELEQYQAFEDMVIAMIGLNMSYQEIKAMAFRNKKTRQESA